MIVTPNLINGLDRPEDIEPPMRPGITIPLCIDLRHPIHDGYVIYVGRTPFVAASVESGRVVKAIAKAVVEHLKTLPPFEVD